MRPGLFVFAGLTAGLAAVVFWPQTPPATIQSPIPYTTTTEGVVAAWDCSHVITWKFNPYNAPAGAQADVAAAVDEVSKTTGLTFQYLGTTKHIPVRADHSGSVREADIVLAYTDPPPGVETSDLLDSEDRQEAGKTLTATTYRGGMGLLRQPANLITSADVAFATSALTSLRYGGQSGTYGLVLHELGHAVGLDHAVQNQKSLMTPTLTGNVAHLTALDKTALTNLYRNCEQK